MDRSELAMKTPDYTISRVAQIKNIDLTRLPSHEMDKERKSSERDKNQEIENLKRLLANISQRLDDLKQR